MLTGAGAAIASRRLFLEKAGTVRRRTTDRGIKRQAVRTRARPASATDRSAEQAGYRSEPARHSQKFTSGRARLAKTGQTVPAVPAARSIS